MTMTISRMAQFDGGYQQLDNGLHRRTLAGYIAWCNERGYKVGLVGPGADGQIIAPLYNGDYETSIDYADFDTTLLNTPDEFAVPVGSYEDWHLVPYQLLDELDAFQYRLYLAPYADLE